MGKLNQTDSSLEGQEFGQGFSEGHGLSWTTGGVLKWVEGRRRRFHSSRRGSADLARAVECDILDAVLVTRLSDKVSVQDLGGLE